jgi:hypothetical protein
MYNGGVVGVMTSVSVIFEFEGIMDDDENGKQIGVYSSSDAITVVHVEVSIAIFSSCGIVGNTVMCIRNRAHTQHTTHNKLVVVVLVVVWYTYNWVYDILRA